MAYSKFGFIELNNSNSNIEKTVKNSLISVISQFVTLVLQFVNRKVFVLYLNVELLGCYSLFANIFNIISIAELGIGNIIAFHLYKQIVNNNKHEIASLMCLYKILYRAVALIVFILAVVFSFFLPSIIKDSSLSNKYIYLIYYLQFLSILLSFFLSYKRVIFISSQQEYKCVKVDLYVSIVLQSLQLFFLFLFKNYLIYLCIQISTTLISNIIISKNVDKEFPYLSTVNKVTWSYVRGKRIFLEMKNFFIHKISYAIFGGTDNIIISTLCGVKSVAIYSNYIMIQYGVMQILFYRLLNPVQATIGNIVYSNRSKEELWYQFLTLDVFSFFYASYIGLGFLVFFQPVIQLWMGVEYLLPFHFVVVFASYIYLGAVWEIVYKYRSVFGDYKNDRWFMVIAAVANVCLSIPAAKLWGVTGVQVGTLVSFIFIALGRIRFVVKNYFERSMINYLLKHSLLFCVFAFECLVCYELTDNLECNLFGLFLRFILWFFVPLIINSIIYHRSPHFKHLISYLIKVKKIMFKRFLDSILRR